MRGSIDDEVGTGRGDPRASDRFDMTAALDMLGRRIGGALVLGGALIGLGLYWGSDTQEAQTYQAFAADGEVFRVNTDSGTIIACNATRCTRILERGQELAEEQGNTLFRVPPPPSEPAAQLPAPAPQQAQPATPVPADQGAPKQVDTGE